MPFTERDIELIRESWKEKLKKVEFLGRYSLKHREHTLKERLEKYIEFTEKLLEDKKRLGEFLNSLNEGTYNFSPFRVFYVANHYFGKMRLTLQVPIKEDSTDTIPKGFFDLLTLKLLAKELKSRFNDVSYNIRSSVILKLQKTLDKADKTNRYIILRGDFRNYTLNIPRNKLLELLKERIEEVSLINLVEKYLTNLNQVSKRFYALGKIRDFFSDHYGEDFKKDSDFKAMTGTDGIVPGTPLSTVLGWIFLHKFDRFVEEELLKGQGFYARFLDDFIIVVPEGHYEKDFEKRLIEFLSNHYGVSKKWVEKNLIKLEKPRKTSEDTEFDFLGYLFKFENGKLAKTTIRYKTVKKFLYKYLYEYSFDRYKSKFVKLNCKACGKDCLDIIRRYLTAKAVYLNQWLSSFIRINDKKLLDKLYKFYILPYLYKETKEFKKICPQLNVEKFVKEIRNFFKPTLIHRQLVKRDRSTSSGNYLTERFKRIEEKLSQSIDKIL